MKYSWCYESLYGICEWIAKVLSLPLKRKFQNDLYQFIKGWADEMTFLYFLWDFEDGGGCDKLIMIMFSLSLDFYFCDRMRWKCVFECWKKVNEFLCLLFQ